MALNETTLNSTGSGQRIRGGLSVDVPVMSSNVAVGTITVSPLNLASHEFSLNTAFDPQGVGMADISIATPAGFDTPSNDQQITATVDL